MRQRVRMVADWVRGAPLPHDFRLLRRLDRLERGLRLIRDERIPARHLNFNQRQSLYWWRYASEFTADSVTRELPFLVDHCRLTPRSAVLDYGCGLGRSAYAFSEYLSPEGRYYGLDIVREAIDYLSRAYAGYSNFQFHHIDLAVDHYQSDKLEVDNATIPDAVRPVTINRDGVPAHMVKIPLPDESIEINLAISIFSHMYEDEIVATLKELRRVTKPDGYFFHELFVVDEHALREVDAGRADRQFPYRESGMFCISPTNLVLSLGYSPERFERMYAAAGLRIDQTLHGSWAGRDNGITYEDIIVARRV